MSRQTFAASSPAHLAVVSPEPSPAGKAPLANSDTRPFFMRLAQELGR
jgi:hypothetical protein